MWKAIFTLAFLALLFNREICNGKGHSLFKRTGKWYNVHYFEESDARGIFVLAVLQVVYRGI